MKKLIVVIVAILAAAGLFAGGYFLSQASAQTIQPGWMMGAEDGQYGPEMMSGQQGDMMGNGQYGPGMMAGQQSGMMGSGHYGPGMMSGQHGGMMGNGQYGPGMMAGQHDAMVGMMNGFADLDGVEPLTVEEAESAVHDYLATLEQETLEVGEIMIFNNHAYAQILDSETGQGAFEVLVDPVSGNVFPEPGPNMMWNSEYGVMSGEGYGMMGSGMMHGGMMGGSGYVPETEISVTAEEAVSIAQEYLDTNLPGKSADDHADTFPGYYTLHILEDGEIYGMLSVNAYTGQVFLHHWHSDFIEMAALGHE